MDGKEAEHLAFCRIGDSGWIQYVLIFKKFIEQNYLTNNHRKQVEKKY